MPAPDADLPEAAHTGEERLTGVFHMSGLIGSYLAAVPQVADMAIKFLRGGSNEYLISGLFLGAGVGPKGLENPA